jgi:hypothetical protein
MGISKIGATLSLFGEDESWLRFYKFKCASIMNSLRNEIENGNSETQVIVFQFQKLPTQKRNTDQQKL